MEQITLKLSELVRPDRNIRIHTEKQLQEYERSVRMFGQIRPIVVDESNNILAGNGLYDTLVRMGEETALVYRYTNLTDNQKKKLIIADNRIYSLGIENMETLNEFLEEMRDDLDIPGFDEDILQQMVADAEEITERISEYGTLEPEEIKQVQAAGERRDQKMEQPVQQSAGAPVPVQQSEPESLADTNCDQSGPENPCGPQADVQKFVICPKCGEKIWL